MRASRLLVDYPVREIASTISLRTVADGRIRSRQSWDELILPFNGVIPLAPIREFLIEAYGKNLISPENFEYYLNDLSTHGPATLCSLAWIVTRNMALQLDTNSSSGQRVIREVNAYLDRERAPNASYEELMALLDDNMGGTRQMESATEVYR